MGKRREIEMVAKITTENKYSYFRSILHKLIRGKTEVVRRKV